MLVDALPGQDEGALAAGRLDIPEYDVEVECRAGVRLRGVPVPQQILRRDVGRRHKPVVLLLHDLDLILIRRNLEHGDQVILRELGEDGSTNQIR